MNKIQGPHEKNLSFVFVKKDWVGRVNSRFLDCRPQSHERTREKESKKKERRNKDQKN